MEHKTTRERREAELQQLIRTPAGRVELEAIAAGYRAAGGSMRPANTSVITYILVHERATGLIDG